MAPVSFPSPPTNLPHEIHSTAYIIFFPLTVNTDAVTLRVEEGVAKAVTLRVEEGVAKAVTIRVEEVVQRQSYSG
jgi:hypothetical protein